MKDRGVEEIARYGVIRRPEEACGLLLAGRVVELRNVSPLDRSCNYSFGTVEDIVRQLRTAQVDLARVSAGDYVVWHTHPKGLIGPSPGDMEDRIDGLEYLVVALTDDGPVAARF